MLIPIILHFIRWLLPCILAYSAGKTRARDAALNAIQSPLLDIGIERATGIVWNITGGSDLTLYEASVSSSFFSTMFALQFKLILAYPSHT